ncbi:division/outer membrane stress-associated lipid-binding lipoprotein [Colwelliaceae bacterium 6441]
MQFKRFICIAAITATLQGCVAAAVVGVIGGASVANDNRSIGNQVDDQKIELVAHTNLAKIEGLSDNTNLQVVSFNGKVLIVGQSPNSYLKDLAIKTLNNVEGIEHIYDQIRIGNTVSVTTKSNDIWLTSKVKTALFAKDEIDATNIKVVTENGEVFLMGLIKSAEANAAVEVARNISGVNRVFKMFEYIN